MLFPDWANAQDIQLRKVDATYTVTQDSFLIGLCNRSSSISPLDILINGKKVFRDNSGKVTYNESPCFYCAKGTVLKNNSNSYDAIFKVIPLVKSGGE